MNPQALLPVFLYLRKFIPSDWLFLFALLCCLAPAVFGICWFFNIGRKWRHDNWISEQYLKDDKRYTEYFRPLKEIRKP